MPVNAEVIAEVQSLLTVMDQVLANAAARGATDTQLPEATGLTREEKQRLRETALDTMKAQGLQQELQATPVANRAFMERYKINPERW